MAVEMPSGEMVTVEVPPGVTEGQELQFALQKQSSVLRAVPHWQCRRLQCRGMRPRLWTQRLRK